MVNIDFYFGYLMYGNFVFCYGFYGVLEEDYFENIYKDYIFGGGYVLLRDLVLKLILMFDVVKLFKVDDVNILFSELLCG